MLRKHLISAVSGLSLILGASSLHAQTYGQYTGSDTSIIKSVVILCPPSTGKTAVACTFSGGGGGGGAITAASGAYAAGAFSTGAGTDGWDSAEGAKADTACATDNGTCDVIALIKRENQRITSLIAALGTPFQAGGSIGNTSFGATNFPTTVDTNSGAAGASTIRVVLANNASLSATNFPTTADTNAGAAGASTLRVVLATGGATPLPTGAATSANQGIISTWAGGTLGAMANYGTSPGAVLVPGVNAFITNTPSVSQSGTWTVQPGNTANTTPWLFQAVPQSSGGSGVLCNFAGKATATVCDASAGTIYDMQIVNTNSTPVDIQLYAVAQGSVTVGTTTVTKCIGMNPGSQSNIQFPTGLSFANAITIAVTVPTVAGTCTGTTAPTNNVAVSIDGK